MHFRTASLSILFALLENLIYFTAYSQSFVDKSTDFEINHIHKDNKLINGGAALFDFDNDLKLDIYLTGGNVDDHLYRNLGDGRFDEVLNSADISHASQVKTNGVIAGDINNDGFVDLFLTTDKGYRNLLYLNNQDGTFSNISENSGIEDNVWSSSAAFGDYNMDGFLDIYVVNYVEFEGVFHERHNLSEVSGIRNSFYVNNGDNTFTENSENLGVSDMGAGLGVLFTDYDNDNDLDIYVVNDFGFDLGPSVMYENLFPVNSFNEVTQESRLGMEVNGMGVAVGDYNEDHWQDIYTTDIHTNLLYRNNQNGTFTDRANNADTQALGGNSEGVNTESVAWGTFFFDFDNDTYQDIMVATGNMLPGGVYGGQYQANYLFKGSGSRVFEDVTSQMGLGQLTRSRAVVNGDIDNDGDLDIVLACVDYDSINTHKSIIYENTSANGNWINVRLRGYRNNYLGYGSKIKVYSDDRKWLKEVDGGSGYQSHNSSIAHFGLDQRTEVDSIVIVWLGGHEQILRNVAANQTLTISEDCTDIEISDITICKEEGIMINGILRTETGTYEELIDRSDACNLKKVFNVTAEDCVVASIEPKVEFIQAYPNPTRTIVTIDVGQISIDASTKFSLLNMVGQEIINGPLKGNQTQIDLRSLELGTYLLRTYIDNQVKTLRIQKK